VEKRLSRQTHSLKNGGSIPSGATKPTTMEEKKELYDKAMDLLEGCNKHLKDDPALSTLNTLLSSVVKNLTDVLIKTVTGINSDEPK
jgi:hypothetical protein